MKFTGIFFLIIMSGFGTIAYAQSKPTLVASPVPSVSPTPSPTSEIRNSILKVRTAAVTAVSAKTLKESDNAARLMQEDKYTEAIDAYTAIIKTNPKLMIAFNNRGYSYMQSGKLDSAIEDFNTALRLLPATLTYSNRGMALAKKGDFQSSLADFNKALVLNPKDSLVYNNRADVHVRMGNFALALADQNKAISILPTEFAYFSNRCLTHIKMKSFEPALEDCNKAIKLNSKSAFAYMNRGNAYFQAGEPRSSFRRLKHGAHARQLAYDNIS